MSKNQVLRKLKSQNEKISDATVHNLLLDLLAAGDIQEVPRGKTTLYAPLNWVEAKQTGDG
jgi:Fe2+ or Zn2+ uptake regulation protein